MALIGNMIWFLLGGWALFIFYSIAAIIFFPIFLPVFRIAVYSLFPFGKKIISKSKLNKFRELSGQPLNETIGIKIGGVLNLIWILTFGWFLALTHLLACLANLLFCLFVFTIPFALPNALGNWKMIRVAFMPLNTVIVPNDLAEEIDKEVIKGKLKLHV